MRKLYDRLSYFIYALRSILLPLTSSITDINKLIKGFKCLNTDLLQVDLLSV